MTNIIIAFLDYKLYNFEDKTLTFETKTKISELIPHLDFVQRTELGSRDMRRIQM